MVIVVGKCNLQEMLNRTLHGWIIKSTSSTTSCNEWILKSEIYCTNNNTNLIPPPLVVFVFDEKAFKRRRFWSGSREITISCHNQKTCHAFACSLSGSTFVPLNGFAELQLQEFLFLAKEYFVTGTPLISGWWVYWHLGQQLLGKLFLT